MNRNIFEILCKFYLILSEGWYLDGGTERNKKLSLMQHLSNNYILDIQTNWRANRGLVCISDTAMLHLTSKRH